MQTARGNCMRGGFRTRVCVWLDSAVGMGGHIADKVEAMCVDSKGKLHEGWVFGLLRFGVDGLLLASDFDQVCFCRSCPIETYTRGSIESCHYNLFPAA